MPMQARPTAAVMTTFCPDRGDRRLVGPAHQYEPGKALFITFDAQYLMDGPRWVPLKVSHWITSGTWGTRLAWSNG